jgi:hemerythrin
MMLEGEQRERRELFIWLARYSQAVTRGAGRSRLLEIFDAAFECTKTHFLSVEALQALTTSWPHLQQHQALHSALMEALASFRTRLAGSEPLDAQECAHVMDELLIHCIKEQPTFDRIHACLDRDDAPRTRGMKIKGGV